MPHSRNRPLLTAAPRASSRMGWTTIAGDIDMRGRIAFIVLAMIVTAAVAALNWPEITRSQEMNFGLFTTTAPLGLTLLVLLALVLGVFLVSSAIQESRYLMEHRRHTRALQAQRELAEKAEASRFTDLRQNLDSHLRETRQRESMMATEFEKRLMQSHNELRAQLERMHQMIAAKFDALDGRTNAVRDVHVDPVGDVPPRDRVRL
jgi:DNA anti-recombination protein RmuC